VARRDWLGGMDEKDVNFEPLMVSNLKWCRSCVRILDQHRLSHAFGLLIGQNVCAFLSSSASSIESQTLELLMCKVKLSLLYFF
jgi:hypothetical protein